MTSFEDIFGIFFWISSVNWQCHFFSGHPFTFLAGEWTLQMNKLPIISQVVCLHSADGPMGLNTRRCHHFAAFLGPKITARFVWRSIVSSLCTIIFGSVSISFFLLNLFDWLSGAKFFHFDLHLPCSLVPRPHFQTCGVSIVPETITYHWRVYGRAISVKGRLFASNFLPTRPTQPVMKRSWSNARKPEVHAWVHFQPIPSC